MTATASRDSSRGRQSGCHRSSTPAPPLACLDASSDHLGSLRRDLGDGAEAQLVSPPRVGQRVSAKDRAASGLTGSAEWRDTAALEAGEVFLASGKPIWSAVSASRRHPREHDELMQDASCTACSGPTRSRRPITDVEVTIAERVASQPRARLPDTVGKETLRWRRIELPLTRSVLRTPAERSVLGERITFEFTLGGPPHPTRSCGADVAACLWGCRWQCADLAGDPRPVRLDR